jgi:hypothetical protein
MTPRLLVAGAIVTAITVAAAGVAVWREPAVATVDVAGEAAFPLLRQRPEAVARITVSDRDGRFVLARNEAGRWVAPDKHGYPVATDKVRELVVTLAEMELSEAKTAKPERFARLQVEDFASKDAESRSVVLESGDGTVLVDTLVGKRRYAATGGREAGTYLRRKGDERAWLASGGLTVRTRPVDWLERRIVDLAPDTVREIEVLPAEGEGYVAARAAATDDLALISVPEKRKAKTDEVRRLASVLSNVELDDVRPANEVALPEGASLVRIRTFDNQEVAVRTAEIEELRWATLSARATVAADDRSEAAEKARAAAQDIGERTAGWAYAIPAHVYDRLTKKLEAMLVAPEKSGGS